MTPDEVIELIDRYNDAWNDQDLDAIHALHHPEIVFDNHTAGERAEGADAVREHIAAIFANNPTLRFTRAKLPRGRRLRRLRVDVNGRRRTAARSNGTASTSSRSGTA